MRPPKDDRARSVGDRKNFGECGVKRVGTFWENSYSANVNFATESKSVMYIVFSSEPKQQLVAGAGSGIVATFFPSGEITKMPPGPVV